MDQEELLKIRKWSGTYHGHSGYCKFYTSRSTNM